MLTDDEVERALIVTAHPDDLDFGASGTIASWVKAGIEVSYCICTNGDAGGFDPDVPRHEIPGIRQAEQWAAAKVLGVEDIHFLGYHDGKLTPSIELRQDISRVIRRVRPQRVMVQSPERNWRRIAASHPDHMAAGEAALCAIYPDARNPFAHPELAQEGWEAWKAIETWVMATEEADHYVDITHLMDLKLKALAAHVSQTEHAWEEISNHVKDWGSEVAEAYGLPEGHYAERFLIVDTA